MSEVRGCMLLAAFAGVWGLLGGVVFAVWLLASGSEPEIVGLLVSLAVGLLGAVGGFALLDMFLGQPAETEHTELVETAPLLAGSQSAGTEREELVSTAAILAGSSTSTTVSSRLKQSGTKAEDDLLRLAAFCQFVEQTPPQPRELTTARQEAVRPYLESLSRVEADLRGKLFQGSDWLNFRPTETGLHVAQLVHEQATPAQRDAIHTHIQLLKTQFNEVLAG